MMADSDTVHFFDLYSDFPGASKSWSYNTLKTRSVLNFKRVPYTQSWTSYSDIESLGTALGIEPNREGRRYTLPMIVHKSTARPEPHAIMDSFAIAQYLDKTFPSPPLFPSGDASHAIFIAVSQILNRVQPTWRPFVVPRVPDHLDPKGQAYFHTTRAAAFGKPLSQVRPSEKETVAGLWDLAEKESAPLIAMLKGREERLGPFFEGEKLGYADLFLACHFAFIQRFDMKLFEQFMNLGDGEFEDLYNACLPYLEGQGHDTEWLVPESAPKH